MVDLAAYKGSEQMTNKTRSWSKRVEEGALKLVYKSF